MGREILARGVYVYSTSREDIHELNKLTSLPMCGFIAQLVEHRTGITEVTGSNPVEALTLFRLLSNCLNWKFTAMMTLHSQALFSLYLEIFLEGSPDVRRPLEELSMKVGDACKEHTKENIQTAHHSSTKGIQSSEVDKMMSDFDAANATNPLFTVFRQYTRMVMEMFAFIQAVCSCDWKLHLIALELFTKYFFVHDKICYLRMIPLYLAEMASLESSDPEIYREFITGNWEVNKIKEVPFCAVGGDTALEHLNGSMKVSGGLVGIILNESARAKFFLIAPELARLTAEAKAMVGLVPESAHHQELNSAVLMH